MFSNDFKIEIIIIIIVIFSPLTLSNPSEIGSISALYAARNRRNTMEDFAVRIENEAGSGFYAVLDGHEGNYSAQYGKEYLAKQFANVIKSRQYSTGSNGDLDAERMLNEFADQIETHLTTAHDQNKHDSGTTCLMVVAEKYKLTVGNIGDSRAVLCDSNGQAVDLSNDHRAGHNANEEERMIKANPEMRSRDDERIHGLAISRSLGDLYVKEEAGKGVVISKPEIKTFNLVEHRPKFMILASDGLWDKVGSQAAVDYIKDRYLAEEDFGATALMEKAKKERSKDNITVLVVVFTNGMYDVGRSRAGKLNRMGNA